MKLTWVIGKVKRVLQKYRPQEVRDGNIGAYVKEIRASLAQNHGNVFIVFPIIAWTFRWQRPQHITSRFAEHGYTVIYLSMNIRPQGRKYNNEAEAGQDIVISKLADHVYELGLCCEKQFNVYSDKLHGSDLLNMYLGLAYVLHLFASNSKNISYLIHFPGWSPLIFKLKATYGGKVIFDCMDDHSGFSTNTTESVREEQHLLTNADLVITSSFLLEEKAKSKNQNTILAKNGTDFVHFNSISPNGELEHLQDKPIIGYYGAISDWFAMEIVEYCARQRPEWNFVLVGSTFGCDVAQVDKLSNIYFLGEKPYKELPGYLYYFDVCTIPFKIIPLTLATNPVKFYEYLSCGKPVVAVELPELDQYKEYCYLAKSKEDFLVKLEQALAEKDNSGFIANRIELARNNSWDERFAVIESAVKRL